MTSEADPEFERSLLQWLRADLGVEEPRRLVRDTGDEALVSKFEAGFAARMHALLDDLPELFDEAQVIARYDAVARELPADTPRSDVWHGAMHAAIGDAGTRLGIPDMRLAEVRAGIDSVRAILDAVLWSGPAVGDDYAPRAGEVEAYRDALVELADGRDLFTRYYGEFQGRAVQNHCPGAAFARRLLAHAWRACTGTVAPA